MRPGCCGLWAAVKLPLWLKSPSGERQWCSPFSQACRELSPHTSPPSLPSPLSSHQHDLVRRPLPRLTGLLQPTVLSVSGGKCTESCWPAFCVWCCIIQASLSMDVQSHYWPEGHFSSVAITNNNQPRWGLFFPTSLNRDLILTLIGVTDALTDPERLTAWV